MLLGTFSMVCTSFHLGKYRSKTKTSEVHDLYRLSELILAVVADIVAGVALYFICKWLDGKK